MNRQHYEFNRHYPKSSACLCNINQSTVTSRLMAPSLRTGKYTLFHFMCRWTCSSCWRLVLTLGKNQEWLARHGIDVVLVGQSHYFQPAKRMAADYQLPFRLINDDHGTLQRLYGLEGCSTKAHQWTLALTDKKGRVHFWQHSLGIEKGQELATLKSTFATL